MILLSAWTALWILWAENLKRLHVSSLTFLVSRQYSTESDFPSVTKVLGCFAVILGVGKCFLQQMQNYF